MSVSASPGGGAAPVETPPTPAPPVEAEVVADRPALTIPVPGLGVLELSRPEIVYLAGIGGLTALGLLEWPIALVMAGGSLVAADRTARTLLRLPGRA